MRSDANFWYKSGSFSVDTHSAREQDLMIDRREKQGCSTDQSDQTESL